MNSYSGVQFLIWRCCDVTHLSPYHPESRKIHHRPCHEHTSKSRGQSEQDCEDRGEHREAAVHGPRPRDETGLGQAEDGDAEGEGNAHEDSGWHESKKGEDDLQPQRVRARGSRDPGQQEAIDKRNTGKGNEDTGALERAESPAQQAPYA